MNSRLTLKPGYEVHHISDVKSWQVDADALSVF